MGSRKDRHTDEEIISGIRGGGARMEVILAYVYQRFWPMIRDFVRKHNGSPEEAEEVFQEGVIGFYENVITGKFQQRSSVSSYLYSICKYNWHARFKKRMRTEKVEVPLGDLEKPEASFLGRLMEKDEYENALVFLEKLGEGCKKILVYVHYFNYPMKEIAQMMGFKNDQIARNKHYRCNKSLEQLLERHSQKKDH